MFRLLLLLLIIAQGNRVLATHIFGGELLYSYVSSDTNGHKYKVTLTFYGDCGADSAIFNSLYGATPKIDIINNGFKVTDLRLKGIELGTEVSPVCPEQLSNTTCNGGTLPGVRRFVYSDTVNLPMRSKNWEFVFAGDMGPTIYGSGRSSNITNITTAGATVIQLDARLDNSTYNNSSPVYSAVPTPFYCINILQQYNQGAIDPDGDSITFDLVSAIDARTAGPVNYVSSLSETNPIATGSGGFTFNGLNGQIKFISAQVQDALVVCQVSEYRGGVVIGTSEREMTFVILDNCKGTPPSVSMQNVQGGRVTTPPSVSMQNVQGGRVTSDNVVNICVGTKHLSFDLAFANPDGDRITVTNSALPGSSVLNVSGSNTTSPSASFDWTTENVAPGIYTFYVSLKNDHCPIANKQTIAYTINITPIPQLVSKIITPTQCVHDAYVEYDMKYGYVPRTLTISKDGSVFKSYTDSTGVITDSLPLGSYVLVASSDPLCTTTGYITINDSGHLPLTPINQSHCLGEPETPLVLTPVGPGAVFQWFSSTLRPLSFAPVPNTSTIGTQVWFVIEQYKICTSDIVPVYSVVHEPPKAQIVSTPAHICLGDTIYLEGTGGVKYTWSPENLLYHDDSGKIYIRVTQPTVIKLVVEDQYGCFDSTFETYKDIEHCCTFSFPNAFSPNGDGVNDGYRVVSYGNLELYHLLIYNRWGQLVYESRDPRQYWDGKYNGVPCDMGTYMYYFKGTCLTGRTEEGKGDVILIR